MNGRPDHTLVADMADKGNRLDGEAFLWQPSPQNRKALPLEGESISILSVPDLLIHTSLTPKAWDVWLTAIANFRNHRYGQSSPAVGLLTIVCLCLEIQRIIQTLEILRNVGGKVDGGTVFLAESEMPLHPCLLSTLDFTTAHCHLRESITKIIISVWEVDIALAYIIMQKHFCFTTKWKWEQQRGGSGLSREVSPPKSQWCDRDGWALHVAREAD